MWPGITPAMKRSVLIMQSMPTPAILLSVRPEIRIMEGKVTSMTATGGPSVCKYCDPEGVEIVGHTEYIYT